MECKEEEARRAMDIAATKLSENDYYGAKKFINQAQNLYPELDGLNQVSMMIHVYISASSNKNNGSEREESDWYEILGVDPLADDEEVKKQYKKLALLLHPDKNKFNGAEGAFKLVLEAWCRLSDQKRKPKPKEAGMTKPPPKPHKPPSSNKPKHRPRPGRVPEPKPEHEVGTFWSMCNRCNTYCEFVRANSLNKTLPCPNCGKGFFAAEIFPEVINGWPGIRLSPSHVTSCSSTSVSDSTKAAAKRVKRWFEPKLESDSISKKEKVSTFTFWTVCDRCKTYCRFVRAVSLNKTLPCPNCYHDFVAAEIVPEVINGSPVIRMSPSFRPTKSGNSSSSSSYSSSSSSSACDRAKAAKRAQEGVKKWFGET